MYYLLSYSPVYVSAVVEIMVSIQTLSGHFCILFDLKRFGQTLG